MIRAYVGRQYVHMSYPSYRQQTTKNIILLKKPYIQKIQYYKKIQIKNPNPMHQTSTVPQPTPQQDTQLTQLIEQELKHIMKDSQSQQTNEEYTHSQNQNNVYFDKQLTHLVVSEEFQFQKISALLELAFRDVKIDTSVEACRKRWTFLHKNRHNVQKMREKQKQQKRIKSVAAFSNPYSLYSVDQLIDNLELAQRQKQQKNEHLKLIVEPKSTGYNIFKDSFRKIDNIQEYNALQAKMKQALKNAQQQVYEEKPLFFTPQYENLEQFKVNEEELTADKVKQLMAFQIQMEKISRELQVKKQVDEERKYEEIIKRRVQKQEKVRKQKKAHNADIEDDWDQYESD